MVSDLNYLQALRACCRDEAAFEQLKLLLNLEGESVEEIVSQTQTQVDSDFQFPTVTHSWENLLPAEIYLAQSDSTLEKVAANKLGIIFQLLNCDDSRWLLFTHSGCQEFLELASYSAYTDPPLLWNLIHPDDREAYEQSLVISAANLQPWIWEGSVITKSGNLKWMQTAARPILQGNNDIYWNGLLIDITERKTREEALLLSEEKFSIAFRYSPDAMSITTFNEGRYIDVNDSYLRLSNYKKEEVIGCTSLEINAWVNPEDRIRMQQMLREQGAIHNQEFEFRKKSGEVGIYLFSAEIVNINGESCLVSVRSDITESKAAEALARATAERDRLLYEIALRIRRSLDLNEILNTTVEEVRQFLHADRVFISYFDEKGQGTTVAESVDPNFPSILGWVTENVAYKEVQQIFELDRIRVVNDTTKVEKSAFIAEYHNRYQVKAGIGVPIMLGDKLYGILIANQCSAPREWQQYEIDLLDQLGVQVAIAIQQSSLFQQVQTLNANLERQVEERTAQLQQKMQELQELNRIKDVVLHTVSHDLRTSVQGTIMVLNNLLGSPEEKVTISRSLVERMIQGNERQLSMIQSLIETNTNENRGIVLQRELVQLNTLVPAILRDLQPMLAENQATIKNMMAANLPLVMVDPYQSQRVFENLFTYALKQNPPGLKLTLKAKVDKQMIRFTIEDNGRGMSQLECDRLFNLFVRDPQARCSTNIGLKLYLCRQIITAHGGEIGVTSRPNRGSTFWFTFPLATAES
ncbi:PAS domain S-box protein [Trichocoleus sp. Lan]|uniref:PAS domain-containing sensor histidine kinase n=1 Tax=Trichocoleus sp. Lan TaxID=2933927 RepID=UPI003298D4CE